MRLPASRSRGPGLTCGFTLVELLVVIGIIALLLSVLMPALARAREQANRIKCANNIKQLLNALYMYSTEYKQALPYGNPGTSNLPGWMYDPTKLSGPPRRQEDVQYGTFHKYLNGSYGIWHCPNDVEPYVISSFPGSIFPLSSYTINVVIVQFLLPNTPSMRMTRFKQDSILFWEPEESGPGAAAFVWDDGTSAADQSPLTTRHGPMKANPRERSSAVGIIDGHVEFVTRRQWNDWNQVGPFPNPVWCKPGAPMGGAMNNWWN